MATFRHIVFLLYILGVAGFEMESSFLGNIAKKMYQSGRVPNKCDEAMLKLLIDAKKWKEYATKMIDSMGKIPSGLFEMNIYYYGAYDQCLAIDFPEDNARGKYCLAHISIPFHLLKDLPIQTYGMDKLFAENGSSAIPLKILWGLCIPDVCTSENLSNYFPKEIGFTDVFCQSLSEPKEFKPRDIAAIWFFIVISVVIVLSTVYDYYSEKCDKVPSKLLIAFSFLTNGKKLLATTSDSADQLSCIGGIRTLTIMWIVMFHLYLMASIGPVSNYQKTLQFLMSENSMIMKTATLGVDTFFMVGGVVMVYSFMRMKKHIHFNVLSYYFHRYLRLTPQLAVVLLVQITLSEYIGSGPIWPKRYEYSVKNCEKYWWSTLLYIQNWINPNEGCIGGGWYLCLDFQYFILSPLILIPLKNRPKLTLSIVAILACVSMLMAFMASWEYKLTPFINDNFSDYDVHYYKAIQTRAAPWLIGIITGYLIHQVKFLHINFKLAKIYVLILWIVSLSTIFVIVTKGNELDSEERHNRWLNGIYFAFVRPAWAVAVAWIVFACTLGFGGPINDFLSLDIFQIMGRLSYSIYLINVMVLTIITFSQREPPRFSNMVLYHYWSHLGVMSFISVILTLAFDYPIAAIEKLLKGNPTPIDNTNEENEQTEMTRRESTKGEEEDAEEKQHLLQV